MPAFPTIRSSAIGDQFVQSVDARELHTCLSVGRDFSNWIKGRLTKYGFALGVDYVAIEDLSSPNPASSSGHGGARPQRVTEYHLTLDTAKELAMVENNDHGRAVRRHFIERERQLRAIEHPRSPDPATSESLTVRLRLVSKARQSFGVQASRELWFALGLPIVPAMREPSAQAEMRFTLGGARVGGHA